jgi:hypothetical protein
MWCITDIYKWKWSEAAGSWAMTVHTQFLSFPSYYFYDQFAFLTMNGVTFENKPNLQMILVSLFITPK